MYKKAFSGLIAIATTLALGLGTPAIAEELAIPVMKQADRATTQTLPANGQSQQTVRARLGSPTTTSGPVGTPPISSWEYPEFIVYFEGDKVIHTVMKPHQ